MCMYTYIQCVCIYILFGMCASISVPICCTLESSDEISSNSSSGSPCVCVCARARVRVCARSCVCALVRVCHPTTSPCASVCS